jgi:hypothetical protein
MASYVSSYGPQSLNVVAMAVLFHFRRDLVALQTWMNTPNAADPLANSIMA